MFGSRVDSDSFLTLSSLDAPALGRQCYAWIAHLWSLSLPLSQNRLFTISTEQIQQNRKDLLNTPIESPPESPLTSSHRLRTASVFLTNWLYLSGPSCFRPPPLRVCMGVLSCFGLRAPALECWWHQTWLSALDANVILPITQSAHLIVSSSFLSPSLFLNSQLIIIRSLSGSLKCVC